MSAAATSPAPPPSAWPWTRATTGAGHASIASNICRIALASATFSSTDKPTDARIHSTSAPAQKLAPSPASTTALARPTSTNAFDSSSISCASNALRRSGRASVMRSTEPSRSTRSAFTSGILWAARYSRPVLRGAIAAALTPLSGGGAVLDEDAFEPVRRLPRGERSRRAPRPRDDGRGRALRRRRAQACGRAFHCLPRTAPGRRPLRSAEHGRHRAARRARSRGGRGRRCGDRAAVLRARRRRAARAFRRRRAGVRSASVLRLRVRRAKRICRAASGHRTRCGTRRRTSSG